MIISLSLKMVSDSPFHSTFLKRGLFYERPPRFSEDISIPNAAFDSEEDATEPKSTLKGSESDGSEEEGDEDDNEDNEAVGDEESEDDDADGEDVDQVDNDSGEGEDESSEEDSYDDLEVSVLSMHPNLLGGHRIGPSRSHGREFSGRVMRLTSFFTE